MQPPKVTDWLHALWASLPESLVSQSTLAAQLKAASSLPPLYGGASLEFHLCGPEQVDLFFRLLPKDRERLRAVELPRDLAEIVERWRDPEDILHTMPFVDVGIDVGEAHGPPFAGLTFEPIESGLRRMGLTTNSMHREQALARTIAAATLVERGRATAGLLRVLDRCHRALPLRGALHYASSLDARQRGDFTFPALRVITTLPSGKAREYLLDVGWPGDLDATLQQFATYLPARGEASLDLDLLESGPTPRLAAYVDFHMPRITDRTLQQTLHALRSMPKARGELLDGVTEWVSRGQSVCGAIARHFALTFKVVRSAMGALNARVYLSLINPELGRG